MDDPEAASSKVAALLATLRAAAAARPPDGKGAVKAVVFSQFTGGSVGWPVGRWVGWRGEWQSCEYPAQALKS